MKKIILLAMILLGSVAWQPEATKEVANDYKHYIVLTNNTYESMRVTIWFDNDGKWEGVYILRIPSQKAAHFKYDDGKFNDYGYTRSGDNFVHRFRSDYIDLY